MPWVIAIVVVVVVVVVAAVVFFARRQGSAPSSSAPGVVASELGRPLPPVEEFHVRGDLAIVHFAVPLPLGDVDEVLRDLLVREAVEVVREKRHELPIAGVHRVVAMARRAGEWVEVGGVSLETPGELPPPMRPELLPYASRAGFDPLAKLADLPAQAPGLASRPSDEGELTPVGEMLLLPAAVEAGLRSQGLEPASASAGEIVIGMMRLTGYTVQEGRTDSYMATRGGQRAFVRLVPHAQGEHPELDETSISRFAVDFVQSGADRGLLITGKWSPFEVYERERRDPRVRYITRERLQHFVDTLALS